VKDEKEKKRERLGSELGKTSDLEVLNINLLMDDLLKQLKDLILDECLIYF